MIVPDSKTLPLPALEQAVRNLPPCDLASFRRWFDAYDAEAWDREFEEDIAAGRLDALGDEALRDLREGRCTKV